MDNDYINFSNNFWEYYLDGMPQGITESSTTHNSIFIWAKSVPKGFDRGITFTVDSEAQTKEKTINLWKEGIVFDQYDAKRLISIHQDRLSKAKSNIINKILVKNPLLNEKENVISDLGVALNKQIDKDPNIYKNPKIKNNINEKLTELG